MKFTLTTLFLLIIAFVSGQTLKPFIIEKNNQTPRFTEFAIDNESNIFLECNYSDSTRIFKYSNETLVKSVVLDRIPHSVYLMEMKHDTLFLFGVLSDNGDKKVFVIALNEELEVLLRQDIDIEDNMELLRFRKFHFKNYTYLHYASDVSYFIRFEDYFENPQVFVFNEYLKNSEPLYITDTSIVYPSNYGSNSLYHFNENLEFIGSETIADNVFTSLFGGVQSLPDNKYLIGNNINVPHNIMLVDSSFSPIDIYNQFGDDDDKFAILRNFASNKDTSIVYAAGYTNWDLYSFPLGSNEPNSFWVAKFENDTLKWHKSYSDDINYYVLINMHVGPNNELFLSSTRYDAINQPDYRDAVIFRIEPDGTLPVGFLDKLEKTSISVYPNPGQDQLYIESGNSTGVFSIYNLSGQIILSKELTGKETVNAANLTQGIYFYRFVNSRGEVASGKWVKE